MEWSCGPPCYPSVEAPAKAILVESVFPQLPNRETRCDNPGRTKVSRAYAESQGDSTGTNKEDPSVLGQSHQIIPGEIGCDRFIRVL